MAIRIGFVGLGKMGSQMANNLQQVGSVRVWDALAPVAEAHADNYGTEAVTKLSALHGCDIISLCVPTLKESRKVCMELVNGGAVNMGTTIIDHTSGDPMLTKSLSKLMEEYGVNYFDAPVSGGPAGAAAGSLACMVGQPGVSSSATDVYLSAIASKVVYLDSVGSGNAVKSVNNMLNATHLIIASQCMEALRMFGVDTTKALSAINESSGRSLQTEERIPVEVLQNRYNYGFKLGLMHKDVKQCRKFLMRCLMALRVNGLGWQ